MKLKYILGILMFLIIAVGTASATPTIITLDNNDNVNFEHATVTYTPDVTDIPNPCQFRIIIV